MQIAGRKIRASWQQMALYASALLIALEPWTSANLSPDVQKWVEFAKIVFGVLVASGARSFIQRKPWTGPTRAEKTLTKGKDTPPSV